MNTCEQFAKYIWQNRQSKPTPQYAIFVHDKNDYTYYVSWFADCFNIYRPENISDIQFLRSLNIFFIDKPSRIKGIRLNGLFISDAWTNVITKNINKSEIENYFQTLKEAIRTMRVFCPASLCMMTDDNQEVRDWKESNKLPFVPSISEILK